MLTLIIAHFRRWLLPSKALFQYQAPHVVDGSGDWLFRHESYRSWILSDQNDLLWIRGKAGSGKSTLMRLLSDSIRHDNALHLQEPAIAASIIFDFRYVLEPEKGGAKGSVLRALLYQILDSDPTLLPRLCQALSPLSPFPERPEDMDVRCYQLCLEAALSAATDKAKVFFLIDGLEECKRDVQEDVMACLASIYQQARYTNKVRIMITSRWGSSMQRIQRQFQTEIRCLEMENREDIATFCSAKLSPRRTSRGIITGEQDPCVHWKDSVEKLVDSIITRADGVFLWVSLVVDLLLNDYPAQQHPDCGTKTWQQAVQELPTGLDLLYENLLDRIPTRFKPASEFLFMWCSHTFRPLQEPELHSLIQLDTDELKSGSAWNEMSTIDMASQLRHLTYGLVELVFDLESGTKVVRLVHASVKEFLTAADARSGNLLAGSFDDPIGLAHTTMAKTSLRCIRRASDSANNPTDPLLKYSVLYWSCHAQVGEQLAVPQEYLIEVFECPSTGNASLWLEGHEKTRSRQKRSARNTSLLHVAARYGLFSTIKAMSERNPAKIRWDSKDHKGRTPLYWAAAQGHTNVVRLLLEHGASVNAEGFQKMTPLQIAAQMGHTGILTALLAKGANTTMKDASGSTAIHHAARTGQIDALKLLIASGADPNALDLQGHSALTLAAASGNEDLAEFLLKLNNLSWSASIVGAALTFAAALGLKTLTRSLLRSGRFRGPDDIFVQQAFIASIIAGSEDLLLLFLELGCHPDLHDYRYGQSALSIAAAGGHDRLVHVLLQHGANANIRDIHTGITPVMHAISRGFPVIVRLLLESGSELEIPKVSDEYVEDSWIQKIVLVLIHECPNGNSGRSNSRKSTKSSTESVAGSFTHEHKAQSSSGKSRKRSRPKQETDGNEEGSDDERLTKKGSPCENESDAQLMCPFHRRYPEKHTCPPFPRVSRLK